MGTPTRRFWAPGRVNLIGEHTDHTGGLVLPAAIDRGIELSVVGGGDRIRLSSDTITGEVDVAADGSEMPDDGWGRYVAAVAAELAALGRAPVGVVGTVTSDLPAGSGLSSSAALEVAVGTALCAVAGLALDPLVLAGAMQRAEQRGVGVPCGIMDQAASILGREGAAVLLDCDTLVHRAVPLPDGVELVLIDSGVRRRLGESGYAERTRELRSALRALDTNPSRVAWDEVDVTGLSEVEVRRLRHVVTENQRVREVVSAMEAGDLASLGERFADGHASLRDDFEVSTPELDRLVSLAVAEGAVAARMTGGGFGGAIVVLARVGDGPRLAGAVEERYRDAFPDLDPTVLRVRAAAGAHEITEDT